MLVQQARELARRWVYEHASHLPGYGGAFVHGSANWLADDAPLPPTSDLDVMIVFDGPLPSARPGKLLYQGALLEISFIARDELRTPEQVLGSLPSGGQLSPAQRARRPRRRADRAERRRGARLCPAAVG